MACTTIASTTSIRSYSTSSTTSGTTTSKKVLVYILAILMQNMITMYYGIDMYYVLVHRYIAIDNVLKKNILT